MKVTVLFANVKQNKSLELVIRDKSLFIDDGVDITFECEGGVTKKVPFKVINIDLLNQETTLIEESRSINKICQNREVANSLDFTNLTMINKGDISNSRRKL